MMPLQKTATRITTGSATRIDHVFQNRFFDNPDCGVLDDGLVDHCASFVKLSLSYIKQDGTGTTYKVFVSFIMKMQDHLILDYFQTNRKFPSCMITLMGIWNVFRDHTNFYWTLHLSETMKKKRKPPWFKIKVKIAIIKKKQTMKHFTEVPTASYKKCSRELVKKTVFTFKGANCNHFSNVFSICMNKPKEFYRALNEMTGKRGMITNLDINNGNKDIMNSLTVFADMFNQKFNSFATTVEGPTTQELKKCTENNDNNDEFDFAFPTNTTDVFITVGDLNNNKAVGMDGVSA